VAGPGRAFIYKILVYPIKSLPPVELPEARVTRWGTLEWDRVYVIVDERGRVVNGKRERRLHLVRARYSLRERRVFLSACCGGEEELSLDEPEEVSRWLSRFLGYRVELRHVPEGAPDDSERNGPTLVSLGTLQALAEWFEPWGWDISQARLRLRSNLEVAGVPPFWEDTLYRGDGRGARVRIGGRVVLEVRGISRRCVVPMRDPYTAAPTPGFQRMVAEARREHLAGLYPEGDTYRLAANTVVVEGRGEAIRLLDPVEVEG
jgi:uncharacterized protein YcbX